MSVDPSVAERFWKNVQKGEPHECWNWTSPSQVGGYGSFYYENRLRRATHISLGLAGRPLTKGLLALHKCDNPACVNPDHIFEGTLSDNMQDCLRKKRFLIGSRSPHATLNEAQVANMRALSAAGLDYKQLALFFHTNADVVRAFVINRSWKHVRPAFQRLKPIRWLERKGSKKPAPKAAGGGK
jgi:hypothetical protein